MANTSRRQRRRSSSGRVHSQQRRQERRTRPTPTTEPVDYSQDYAFVRRDLRRIVIWSGLLFVLMIGAAFAI